MLLEKARGAPPMTRGGGTHHTTVPTLKDDRPLMPPLGQLRAALRNLRKVEQIHIKPAAALEIVHIVVNRVDAEQAQGRLGHTNSLPPGGPALKFTSNCASGRALGDQNTGQHGQGSTTSTGGA